eukprot:TRINITY_DN31496_c0_g1_i1.p1 TRINITY_DN31496_c0_g1~~TRINITY_DN31496_c0_g1_i1.p1  ORF type:complete len:301 (-),score=50.71 TRINITY_DN31496_c0_g1_i1:166-1068(-)
MLRRAEFALLALTCLSSTTHGLKIIGAGFGRTGTDSLKTALGILGYRTYHMKEIMENWRIRDLELWTSYFNGSVPISAIADEMYAGNNYTAAVDFPTSAAWQDLADYYPEAKIILTERSTPENWYDSARVTILQKPFPMAVFPLLSQFFYMFDKMTTNMWKVIMKLEEPRSPRGKDKDTLIEAYKENSETARDFDERRMLIFDVKEGWEPLCDFLKVEVPETPFPTTNSRSEFQNMQYIAIAVLVVPLLLIGAFMLYLSRIFFPIYPAGTTPAATAAATGTAAASAPAAPLKNKDTAKTD